MIFGALPKPPRFLEHGEVLTLHESAIDQFGGSYGVRDEGLLDAALSMPKQAFGGEFAHAVPFGMAAAYAFHICKNHPFIDGNKRTALATTVVFLHMNGWVLDIPDIAAADQILACAEGKLDKNGLIDWVSANSRPRPSLELRDFFNTLSPTDVHNMATRVIASGRESEAQATMDETFQAIEVARAFNEAAHQAKTSGDDNAYISYNAMTVLLVAIYRLAEDMGYEW